MAQPARARDFVGEECLALTAELRQARMQVLKLRRALEAGGPHQSSLARSLENRSSIEASRTARLRLFAQRHGLAQPHESLIRIRA